MVMSINGIEYIHISEFADNIGYSVQAIRYLCQGGGRRSMQYIRDGSRILIPVQELTEYPFTNSGKYQEQIFHYKKNEKEKYVRYLCECCTFRERIELCKEAQRLYEGWSEQEFLANLEEKKFAYEQEQKQMQEYIDSLS